MFGVILFNFQFVTTIPSWLNEKKPGVGVNSSIWWSVVISVLLYIGLGYFGAIAKGPVSASWHIAYCSVDLALTIYTYTP